MNKSQFFVWKKIVNFNIDLTLKYQYVMVLVLVCAREENKDCLHRK